MRPLFTGSRLPLIALCFSVWICWQDTVLGVEGFSFPPPAPDSATLILYGVPLVRQSTDYSCGDASLQSVFGYYGQDLREEQIIEGTHTNHNVGAQEGDLVKFANKNGLTAVYKSGLDLSDLQTSITAKHPVIVQIQAWPDEPISDYSNVWTEGHYVVVIGLDESYVYLMDPSILGGHGYIPTEEFLKRWHGYNDNDNPAQHEGIVFDGAPSPLASWQYTQ